MVQLKIAFLDEEEAYLERLKGYLIRKKEKFFIFVLTPSDYYDSLLSNPDYFNSPSQKHIYPKRRR